jgi:hypothetical protein
MDGGVREWVRAGYTVQFGDGNAHGICSIPEVRWQTSPHQGQNANWWFFSVHVAVSDPMPYVW